MLISTNLDFRFLRFFKLFLILLLVSGLDLFAEFKVTSIGANQKVGSSNTIFDKNWLCENTGDNKLSVTLSSNKSSRTSDSWGLENISEKFDLEAGGTQNCGIKLTTGKKGIGDAQVNLKTNDGFDRNILISYFTDEFDIINCNLTSLSDSISSYNNYLNFKQFDYVNFNQNDYQKMLNQSNYSKTVLVNKSNGDLDSTEAEMLVDLFMSGKSLVISGADIFYNLSLTHPEHRIWSAFKFIINEKIVNENYSQDFGVEIIDTKNTTSNIYQNVLKLNKNNLVNKPIRSIIPQISDAMNIYQNILLAGTEDVVGFSAEYPDLNSITILNFDIEDIYETSNIIIIDDLLDVKILSIEDNATKNSLVTYPNPITAITENVKIKLEELSFNSNEKINNVVIIDEIGQTKKVKYELINNEILIDISDLQIGVYFVNIIIGNESYFSKFIKL